MKPRSPLLIFGVAATTAALMATLKFAYDAFSGALVPNLLASLGIQPTPIVLDILLVSSLVMAAYALATIILKILPKYFQLSIVFTGGLWIAFVLVGIAQVAFAHPWLFPSSALHLASVAMAVPVGLWLAGRRKRKYSAA